MGVLNVTPDSFSDGGRLTTPDAVLRQAGRMLRQGADLLDLGAQSTRPGAVPVGAQQELDRLLPALRAIRRVHPAACLSVDTFEPLVAERALAEGADLINNVRGANLDFPEPARAMARVAAAAGCPYVVMHSRGDSQSMDRRVSYLDLLAEVRSELLEATDAALAAGVRSEQILWDPGLGFAKTDEQNLDLLRGLSLLHGEGFPLLVGPSRKRFIGAVLKEPRPRARLWGTAAVCALAASQGVAVLRVHDAGPIAQVSRMAAAVAWPGLSLS
jgi:dihydropteroate synthase